MRFVPFLAANDVYVCADSIKIFDHPVDDAKFKDFVFALSHFRRTLGDLGDDIYWQRFLGPPSRYRFNISAAPLPLNYLGIRLVESAENLKDHLSHCDSLYPDFTQAANDLSELWTNIVELKNNPLLDAIKYIHNSESDSTTALLIREPRLIPLIEEILSKESELQDINVLGAAQLCGGDCTSKLIVIGSVSWFPRSIFYAPRSEEIFMVRYSWLGHKLNLTHSFEGPSLSANRIEEQMIKNFPVEQFLNEHSRMKEVYIDPEEVLPSINWNEIKRRITLQGAASYSIDGTEPEEVEACLVILEGGLGVLQDAGEGTRITAIEFDENNNLRVVKIPANMVEPGMFLLVRTAGGGELIVPIADAILGEEAYHSREMQKAWKVLLSKAVTSRSIDRIKNDLKKYGSVRASEANIRRWMSYKSIKTEYYSDFLAIMRLVGLEEQAHEYWEAMHVIDSAHRKAGQHIRKLLLNQVLKFNINNLEKVGRIDFKLPETDVGGLSAIRVNDIYIETITAPAYALGHLVDLQGELWQE